MNQEKRVEIKEKRKKFHKNFTGQLLSDVARKVPLLSSLDRAREKTENQVKEVSRDKDISYIKKTVTEISSRLQNVTPLANAENSLKKLDLLLKSLQEEVKSNPDFKINVHLDEKTRTVSITPKNKEISMKGTFKIKTGKLEGKKDFLEYINEKIKNGESVEFGEDEIENFSIDSPPLTEQLNEFKGLKKLIISPQFLSNPKTMDFSIVNTNIAYKGVNMAPIYKDQNQITLISQNLPFQLVLIENVKDKRTQIKFKHVEKLNLKDTFKFHNFLYELSKNKEIIFSYSSSGREIGRGSVDIGVPFDNIWIDILRDLVIIDERYNCGFEVPSSVTFEELDKIKSIREIIETKKLKQSFLDISVTLKKDAIKFMLEKLEKEGSINDIKLKFQRLKYIILQKEIIVGDATAELPPLKIAGDITQLKSRIEKENDISVKFIPQTKPEFILNFH